MVLKYEDRKREMGRRIHAMRKEKGLRQAEFLRALYMSDTSLTSLRNWEKGAIMPSLDTLARMAGIFECDIGYLLCDYDEKTRDVSDGVKKTGLSGEALESIIGMHTFGPTKSLEALNFILVNSTTWKFLGRQEETVCENDPLFALANYLIPRGETFYAISSQGPGIKEFAASDYIKAASDNALYNVDALMDRINLDSVEEALKQLKKKMARTGYPPSLKFQPPIK